MMGSHLMYIDLTDDVFIRLICRHMMCSLSPSIITLWGENQAIHLGWYVAPIEVDQIDRTMFVDVPGCIGCCDSDFMFARFH